MQRGEQQRVMRDQSLVVVHRVDLLRQSIAQTLRLCQEKENTTKGLHVPETKGLSKRASFTALTEISFST